MSFERAVIDRGTPPKYDRSRRNQIPSMEQQEETTEFLYVSTASESAAFWGGVGTNNYNGSTWKRPLLPDTPG